MKFSKPLTTDDGNLVRLSGDFVILKPAAKNREKWWLRGDDVYVALENHPLSTTLSHASTLAKAIEVCELHAKLKPVVFPYFVERAKYEIEDSKATAKDPDWRSKVCKISEEAIDRHLVTKVEYEAERLYRYCKYRAFLRSRYGSAIDPAAQRDWQAMLDGTYIQWWRRKSA